MDIYLTLDYELFFGPNSGTVEKCIIEPIEALLKIVNEYNVKFVCFVDAGYLWALECYRDKYPKLESDYQKITNQIRWLAENDHGIELHIHPHWEDSVFDGEKWVFNTYRYRLANFNSEEVYNIVKKYNDILKRVSGINPGAYRAGGWSAQPFNDIKGALEANNIFIDSTVYPGGYYKSEHQFFDFRSVVPMTTEYKFSNDLTIPDPQGEFTEIPISSYWVNPSFYWKFVAVKLMKNPKHRSFGDGSAIKMEKFQILKLMSQPSHTVASIDGYKAKLIKKAFDKYKKMTNDSGNFVLIGHPKAFTPYSLERLEQFIKDTHSDNEYKTFKNI